MNSPGTEPGVVSDLLDLDSIPFTSLRDLENESLRNALRHVVDRTSHVHALYPSVNGAGGERID